MYSTEEVVQLIMSENRDIMLNTDPEVIANYWISDFHEHTIISLDVIKQIRRFSNIDQEDEVEKRLQHLFGILDEPYSALLEQLTNAIKMSLLDDIL